jgi:hypothetical protein
VRAFDLRRVDRVRVSRRDAQQARKAFARLDDAEQGRRRHDADRQRDRRRERARRSRRRSLAAHGAGRCVQRDRTSAEARTCARAVRTRLDADGGLPAAPRSSYGPHRNHRRGFPHVDRPRSRLRRSSCRSSLRGSTPRVRAARNVARRPSAPRSRRGEVRVAASGSAPEHRPRRIRRRDRRRPACGGLVPPKRRRRPFP